ncbi:MAG: hypothetical protein AVDCRST_MAG93-2403, partial [uncultured Chloroflexia bacterium]
PVLPPSDQEFVAEGDDAHVYVAYKQFPKLRGVNNPSARHQGLFLLHKFRLYKPIRESRRADSNR